jgi:protein SCO1/2
MIAFAAMAVSMPLASPAGRSTRLQRRLAALVSRPLFWLAVIVLGLSVPVVNQVRRAATPPLPVLGTLPEFQLTDQEGHAFGAAQLRGYVWMAGFIFTRCPTICPAITARMSKIQHRARGIEEGFRLVSFSVDPAYDTPERLAEYARAHKASPRMWKMLTGPLDAMKSTVEEGLKIAMGTPQGEQDFASLFHGTHFVLVDRQLQIRGYYDSSAPDVEDQILHDATMLINRGQ